MALDKTYSDNANCVAFLRAYAECGNLSNAGLAVGISRKEHYYWLDAYPDYAAAFEQAKETFTDDLEQIALDRVRKQKPGDNPTLLIALLNANRPEKYRPNVVVNAVEAKNVLNLIMGKTPRSQVTIEAERKLDGEHAGEHALPGPDEETEV